MLILYSIALVCYLVFISLLIYGWLRIPTFEEFLTEGVQLSIVIAARNESENLPVLMEALENQNYKRDAFEVIVIDDHSTDGTLELLNEWSSRSEISVKILRLGDARQGKKAALALGIEASSAEFIVQTDADCFMDANWLGTYAAFIKAHDPSFVSGPVKFKRRVGFLAFFQKVEFASLVGTGAASMELNVPNMANGANMCFRKAMYEKVSGYRGNEHIASGDDELLMHKVYREHSKSVKFMKSKAATVTTSPASTWKAFTQQRLRWSGKWRGYTLSHIWILMGFVLVMGIISFFAIASTVFLSGDYFFLWIFLLLKGISDFVFLRIVLKFLGEKLHPLLFILSEVFHIFYTLFFAVRGFGGAVYWKNRKI